MRSTFQDRNSALHWKHFQTGVSVLIHGTNFLVLFGLSNQNSVQRLNQSFQLSNMLRKLPLHWPFLLNAKNLRETGYTLSLYNPIIFLIYLSFEIVGGSFGSSSAENLTDFSLASSFFILCSRIFQGTLTAMSVASYCQPRNHRKLLSSLTSIHFYV